MNCRECMVKIKNEWQHGWFHEWDHVAEIVNPSPLVGGHSGGLIQHTVAIVEMDDGFVIELYPNLVRFIDKAEHKEQ